MDGTEISVVTGGVASIGFVLCISRRARGDGGDRDRAAGFKGEGDGQRRLLADGVSSCSSESPCASTGDGVRAPRQAPQRAGERFSLDFVSDTLADGPHLPGAEHRGRLHTGVRGH